MSVSVTMGVMKPLLGKLATLAGDEYSKLKGVRKQASFLEKELSAMNAALEKMELMDELDPVAKDWRDHVREMAYDMENCIDDFMRQFGGGDAKAGFIKKTVRLLETLQQRHRISNRMEELKDLALEANERRTRYKIDECNYGPRFGINDPRVTAIRVEDSGLVGTDGPSEEVANLLMDTENKLKVVSIVGFGGLGKTTLAQQVYDKIGGKFDCKAFVSVSQRPNMTGLLSCLQLKLGRSFLVVDIQHTIYVLKEYLTNKRYLIVLDDLWDQSAWNIVSRAFPDNCNGSRVVVTTRLEDVARGSCVSECIYRMEPLSNKDSRKLFFGRVYGSEENCPSRFEEISVEILKKCGGLPLAIITVASILASQPERLRDEWESIKNSLGAQFAINPTLEGMKSILNLSYMHLPLYLRACFLYLGIYPEDCEIESNDLVQQWIAEGLVSNLHGQDLEVVAKKYLKELINRNMIQPVRTEHGEVLSCRVHDMIVDLILSKCAEDNFISVAYNQEDMAKLHQCVYKVRRLSLKSSSCGTPLPTIPTSLSQVRSFALFGDSIYPCPLSKFKYLRVLVFERPGNQKVFIDLTDIDQLFQLRYLKVSVQSGMVDLPAEIRGLVHLETLEIYGGALIPSDIIALPGLSHLILPYTSSLPGGIESLKSLRTLHCFYMQCSSLQDIKGLGELTNLRDLRVSGSDLEGDAVDALVSSIGKLCKLRSISLNIKFSEHDDDHLYSLSNPPPHIEKLQMQRWMFKRVPKWICDLQFLHTLSLLVEHLSTDDAHILGKLPSLVHLCLNVLRVPEDSAAAVVCTGLFPVLQHLRLRSDNDDSTACMEFEAGAMPKLRRLVLQIRDNWGGAMPVGMEHLLVLEQIHIDNMFSVHDDSDVECAFRNAAQVHPSRPSVSMC